MIDGPGDLQRRDRTVAQDGPKPRFVRGGKRWCDNLHVHAVAMATDPLGRTNSCLGHLTVNTGHDALRTARSATLPISRCATAPRPWVPITIRSTLASRAYVTISSAGELDVRI